MEIQEFTAKELECIINIVDKALNNEKMVQGFFPESIDAMKNGLHKMETRLDELI